MNDLVKNALAQVAGAVSGMVEEAQDYRAMKLPYPSIAVTEVGFPISARSTLKISSQKRLARFIPFHANGTSDPSHGSDSFPRIISTAL